MLVSGEQIAPGREHHPILADDESAIEHGEVLDRLPDLRVEHVAFCFAQTLKRIDGQLPAFLEDVVVVADGDDGADRVTFESLLSDLKRQLNQCVHHLRVELVAELHAFERDPILQRAAELHVHQRVDRPPDPTGGAQHEVPLLDRSLRECGNERNFHALYAQVVIWGDDQRAMFQGGKVRRQGLQGHRVDQLAPSLSTPEILRGERGVADVEKVVDLRLGGQREAGAKKLAIEFERFGHRSFRVGDVSAA